MSSRVRHPAKSFAMFVVVCAVAWFAYENRHFFQSEKKDLLTQDVREQLREAIISRFDAEVDFLGVQGDIAWRPNEQRYRLNILVDQNTEQKTARRICEGIAQMIVDATETSATVFAYDDANREISRAVL